MCNLCIMRIWKRKIRKDCDVAKGGVIFFYLSLSWVTQLQRKQKKKMSFGVTKWLGIYSNTQFESVSSKVITLSSSIVTILMLFFGGQDKINIEGERELYVKVAGYLGMIYVTAALFDAKARPRLAGFRILGEISILCSYLSVWFLIYAIFERHSIPFVVISIGITLGGYIACSVWVSCGATI